MAIAASPRHSYVAAGPQVKFSADPSGLFISGNLYEFPAATPAERFVISPYDLAAARVPVHDQFGDWAVE
jgi:hypothetical protein